MPVPEYVRARRKDPNNPLKARAQALGLTMVEREVIPSTRRAHEAGEFARDRGALEPMHASLLRRYWSLGQDLWQLDVLRGAAADAGLDPDELQRAIEAGTYREAVEKAVDEARDLGIRAVPTFVFDNRFALQGAQEQAVFRDAMEQAGAKKRA